MGLWYLQFAPLVALWHQCVFGAHEGLDLASMTWRPCADLPTRRHVTMSGVVDGKWYVTGSGCAADLFTSNIVEVWSA